MTRTIRLVHALTLSLTVTFSLDAAPIFAAPAPQEATPAESKSEREERERREREERRAEERRKREEAQQQQNQARQQQAQAKQLRDYEELHKFADDLYKTQPAFKESVDTAYAAKKREHSEFAFAMNTRDQNDEQVTRTGDTFKIEDTLYDNPLVQQYVNRLGQSIAPQASANLFAFRVMLNPVPLARALSTGTIYVSTGFVALAENEAQLAYILAHEIAHVERDHWREDVLMQLAAPEFAEKKQGKWKKLSMIGSGAAAGIGVGTGNPLEALGAVSMIQQMTPTLIKLFAPGGVVGWDSTQEDEADQLALQYMIDRNYDPQTVPRLYDKLAALAKSEKRASFGFIADPARVAGNQKAIAVVADQLKPSSSGRALTVGTIDIPSSAWETIGPTSRAGVVPADPIVRTAPALTPEQKARLASGDLVADSGKFLRVMAELRRDNGIQAFYYDMFRMSVINLRESLDIYAGDPLAHFAYGRSLWLTARTEDERGRAFAAFEEAIKRDTRRVLPQAHLFKALSLIDRNDPSQNEEIVKSLIEYVDISRLMNAGSLPPDMNAIYDSLLQAGDPTTVRRQAMAVWPGEQEVRPVLPNPPPPAPAPGSTAKPKPAAPSPRPAAPAR